MKRSTLIIDIAVLGLVFLSNHSDKVTTGEGAIVTMLYLVFLRLDRS